MMKKLLKIFLILPLILSLGACGKKEVPEPEIIEVKKIAKLSTLEVYYHNVAKSVKTKGKGILALGEKDRKFWIEYDSIAKIGIDTEKIQMEVRGNKVKITLPPAELIGDLEVDKDSFNEDSYIISADGINPNKITPEEEMEAIKKSQEDVKKSIEENPDLLSQAQERAKSLIENYFNQLEEMSGTTYEIDRVLSENQPVEDNSSK